jgi:hypothetical protein
VIVRDVERVSKLSAKRQGIFRVERNASSGSLLLFVEFSTGEVRRRFLRNKRQMSFNDYHARSLYVEYVLGSLPCRVYLPQCVDPYVANFDVILEIHNRLLIESSPK